MAQFRKKLAVVEAWQTGSSEPKPGWLTNAEVQGIVRWIMLTSMPPQYVTDIATLEGVVRAKEGDWIIRGVNGELYPCKPDIFEKTYEPAD